MADNARENVSAFGEANVFLEEPVHELATDESESSDDENNSNDCDSCGDYIPDEMDDIEFEDHGEELVADTSLWSSTEIVRLGCVNHAIQLVVKESLSKNPCAVEVQSQLDKLLAFFNRSNFWHRRLVKKTGKGVVKIGYTRWNGFLLSLARLLEPGFIAKLNEVIQEAHGSTKGKGKIPDMISPEREVEMMELSYLLTPFFNLTKELEGDNVTSSLVILGIITLYKKVAATQCTMGYMKALKSSLCLLIAERFGAKEQYFYSGRGARKNLSRVFDNRAYILAAVLDPRWKLSPFEVPLDEPYQLKRYVPSVEKVKDLLLQEYDRENADAELVDCTEEDVIPEKMKRTDFLSSFISDDKLETSRSVVNEVEEYLQEKRCDSTSDPLEYYRKNCEIGRFPVLCRLARRYLGLPSTSSSMERVFSITGSLNRARRASLATGMMEKIVVYREARKDQVGI
ncbi:unnamed protein product [Allacma fusca]|uniref:HAT C-terminal dimerisation domain-containing protein n=1 Tax=Allacma fusca TaxID=39272 RepID=A0A8J2JVQ1_9HEXA|nr:unnamed protein product [Allacma fusca]